MITSFRVGAVFQVVDEATPVITRIGTEMRELAELAERAKVAIQSIGRTSLTGVNTRAQELAKSIGSVSTAAKGMGDAVDSSATLAATGIARATGESDLLTASLRSAAAASRGIRAPPGIGSGGPPALPGAGGGGSVPPAGGGGGRGGRHGPGPHFGRMGAGVPVLGGHVHASAPSNAGLISGGIAGYVAWKAMHASEELQDQQDKMRRQGRTEGQIANITDQAFNDITKQVPTASASEIVKSVAELTFTRGSFEGGVDAVVPAMKVDALISNATGAKTEGQGFQMYRALEEKLVTQDKPHMDKLLGLMAQGTIATGGKVSGADWFTFARRAKTSWIGASDEEIGTVIPTLIQSLGASTAGTAYQTMHMSLLGAGTLSKQQYEALGQLHLIDESKVTHDKGGRVNVGPGGIIGSLETHADQSKWGRNYLAPAIAALPEGEREAYIAKIGRNRNTMGLFEMFSNPQGIAQFDKDAALIKQAWGIDASYETFSHRDPKGVTEGFTKQFNSMLEALGGPAMQAALPGMRGMTSLFNTVAEAANKHPAGAGAATSVLTGIAAGAAAGFGIGLLGGPIGAGGGALIGGALGAGYSLFNNANSQTKYEAGYGALGTLLGLPFGPVGAALGGLGGIGYGALVAPSSPASLWPRSPSEAAAGLNPIGAANAATVVKKTDMNVNVTVKAETDEPHALAEKIAELLSKYLSLASLHNQGDADSVLSSPFNSGVGAP
jgi:hypothetical protein